MAADVDTSFIAATHSFPESSLHTLLATPTVDLVKAFLKQTETKAREYQALEADKLRTEVELETVVRSSEARTRQLKEAVEKGLKEIESLRVKLSREGTILSQILNSFADCRSRNRENNRRI
jgi:nucleoprotein TPR